jgi:hypothetical protein
LIKKIEKIIESKKVQKNNEKNNLKKHQKFQKLNDKCDTNQFKATVKKTK